MSAPQSLGEFLETLENRDALVRIPETIDPSLEMAEITGRVNRGAWGGRALFFAAPRGKTIPVVTNLFGSSSRLAWALGVEALEELGRRLSRELPAGDADKAFEALLKNPRLTARPVTPPTWAGVPAQKDLMDIPALTSWPGEPSPYLTLAQVVSREPGGGGYNVGLYRLQLTAAREGALCLNPGADLQRHLDAAGGSLPVAVVLGGPPALLLAACAPLPATVEEYAFAAWLQQRPVNVFPSSLHGLPVPAGSEFVLEGELKSAPQLHEGPFGNHTGFYHPPRPACRFFLQKIVHRPTPIYPATVVGPPPRENLYLGKALAPLWLALIQRQHPAVRALHMPLEGMFHRCALVQVPRGRAEGEALLRALLSQGPLRGSRLLVLVGEDVDLCRPEEVFWAVLNRADYPESFIECGGGLGINALEGDEQAQRRMCTDAATVKRVDAIFQKKIQLS